MQGPSAIDEEGLTIVRTIHIGCKGEGLPKAAIRWYELQPNNPPGDNDLQSAMRVFINDTERNDVLIRVPREGRSVLSVSLNPGNTDCRRYICEAENSAGLDIGGVDICPQCMYLVYTL